MRTFAYAFVMNVLLFIRLVVNRFKVKIYVLDFHEDGSAFVVISRLRSAMASV